MIGRTIIFTTILSATFISGCGFKDAVARDVIRDLPQMSQTEICNVYDRYARNYLNDRRKRVVRAVEAELVSRGQDPLACRRITEQK